MNIDATVEAIRQAVGEAEQMAGVEVSGVYAGIAGGHIRGVNSRGVVAVGNKDREVSVVDVLLLKMTFETRGPIVPEGDPALAGIAYRISRRRSSSTNRTASASPSG